MSKKYYIFKNSTLENLFANFEASFSGYGDISYIPNDTDVYVWAYLAPIKTDVHLFAKEIASYLQHLQLVLSQISVQKPVYIFNMHQMHFMYATNNDKSADTAIENYNNSIAELSRTHPNVKILDFSNFCSRYPLFNLIDWRFYYLSQMQINPKLVGDFNLWIEKEIAAIEGKRKKCLVLDLDNTLWGGILGEDGIEGIQIGNTYPGSAYLDFQHNILELSKNGIILTVCSKNNEKDVFEAWEHNPFLLIKKYQLAAWKINWNNKVDNITELAQELNIGLDSMVFIDDNPTERELVKQMLPTVAVPDFPKQPYQLPDLFNRICTDYFQIYKLTDEDKGKLEQYKANAERSAFQKAFTSFDDYLKSLEIVIDIQELNSINLSRIAQMTQKTNQFNLTTKRYTDEDIRMLQDKGALIYCINVSDRFGDNGITGAAIIYTNNETKTANVDSFLLSCRILGKNIEEVFLKYILGLLEQKGYSKVTATYIPTPKNKQVSNFYDKNGFLLDKTMKDGSKKYICTINDLNISISDNYIIKR